MSVYTVRVVGDGGTSVGHGSTKCTTLHVSLCNKSMSLLPVTPSMWPP